MIRAEWTPALSIVQRRMNLNPLNDPRISTDERAVRIDPSFVASAFCLL